MNDDRVGLVGVEALARDIETAARSYRSAEPFPHVVVDDVLEIDVFKRAVSEFPAIDDPSWTSYLHLNEMKYANSNPLTWGPTLRSVAEALMSDEFVALLSAITGFDGLVPDWSMDGGGLHQTVRGGHLNIHSDFTTHHSNGAWRRRINVLLYLNETWKPQWRGGLELWTADMTRCARVVEPVGNRMLVFTTSGTANHGHPDPLASPADVARCSLALYYFTEESTTPRTATRYRARPGDGIKRLSIWADSRTLAAYDALKTRLGLSDRLASGLLRNLDRLRRSSGRD